MHLRRWTELTFQQKAGRSAADPLDGLDAGEATVRLVRVEPGVRHAHVHPDSAEVIHVVTGSGQHHQDDEAEDVGAGDTVYVPAGMPHATVARERMLLVCFFPHRDPFASTVELARRYLPG